MVAEKDGQAVVVLVLIKLMSLRKFLEKVSNVEESNRILWDGQVH